jgi:hypothetical protein
VTGGNWVNHAEAQAEIERSRKRFDDLQHWKFKSISNSKTRRESKKWN